MLSLVSVDPRDPGWISLVQRSHQGSLYTQPEWVRLHEGTQLIAAAEPEGKLIAGIVVSMSPYRLPFVPYQGLLLTRREMPGVARKLIAAAETLGIGAAVTSPPSLVDTRPFVWRRDEGAYWTTDPCFTFFLDKRSRPFPDLQLGSEPQEVSVEDVGERFLAVPWTAEERKIFRKIAGFPSVKFYQNDLGVVCWGTDYHDRGYYIAGVGKPEGLAYQLARRHESADLVGANSQEMNRKKRVFGARLKTYLRWTYAYREDA